MFKINIARLRIPVGGRQTQLAIYKRSREVELEASENSISLQSERDLNPRPTDFKSDVLTHSATLSPTGKLSRSGGDLPDEK